MEDQATIFWTPALARMSCLAAQEMTHCFLIKIIQKNIVSIMEEMEKIPLFLLRIRRWRSSECHGGISTLTTLFLTTLFLSAMLKYLMPPQPASFRIPAGDTCQRQSLEPITTTRSWP